LKEYLISLFEDASNRLSYLKEIPINFDVPKNVSHGDLSVNAAMLLNKILKKNPQFIATEIIEELRYDSDKISKIEIAGPGFINFFFTKKFIAEIIKDILASGSRYGSSQKYRGKKANVEFVSANPTGPLTVGHGRNAVFGDTIANLLEWVGYTVDREYYFNNAGRQMRVLGDSVKQRYLELCGDQINFPEDYYRGEYIKQIAEDIFKEHKDSLRDESPEGIFKQKAEAEIFEDIKKTLARLKIRHKIFFNENTLYKEGKIAQLIEEFKSKNLAYEKDGALWFKFSELGNQQDKVIVNQPASLHIVFQILLIT
jgi:arginyl-tRNA synthetase